MRKSEINGDKWKYLRQFLGILLIMAALLARNRQFPAKKEDVEHYTGIVRLYDYATPTVLGNDFSVINTICEEFSDNLTGSFVRLSQISDITPEESYSYAAQNADIIRLDDSLDRGKIMADTAFTDTLSTDIADIPMPYEDGKVIVPLWYDVAVIIVNTDTVEESIEGMAFDEFVSLCGELAGEGHLLSYGDERIKSVLSESIYPSHTENHDVFTHSPEGISSFYEGNSAVYLGTLKDAASLVRRENRGKEVPDYEILPVPAREEVLYVTEISSYAAMECEGLKRECVLSFMKYLTSPEAVRYTENLGMLPFFYVNSIAYERYPYLRDFALYGGRRVVVGE